MKRTQLLVLSALVAGLQIAVAQASPFPADAEASHNLPALETHVDRYGNGGEVLVILHRRLGTWLPLGGELEPGETPLEAARP